MIIKAIRIWELAHKDECRRLLLGDTATPCEVQSTKSAKRTCAEKEYNRSDEQGVKRRRLVRGQAHATVSN